VKIILVTTIFEKIGEIKMVVEKCDWYDELFETDRTPSRVGVGDAVWLQSLKDIGRFPMGEVLSIDIDSELVIVGIYGRFNSDPHFTGVEEIDLNDFEQWSDIIDGRSGRGWKIYTFLS
jgi:hypothetical protein